MSLGTLGKMQIVPFHKEDGSLDGGGMLSLGFGEYLDAGVRVEVSGGV